MGSVLIHIGYPKAGSTYLQNWFAQHPAMFYNPIGVTGFFNTHDISRYAEKNEKLHECFVLSSEHLSLWKGEADIVGLRNTKVYDLEGYQHRISETLHSLYPHAKVLIVTRGYASIFPSFYSQYISGGGTLTFQEVLDEFGPYFNTAYNYHFIISQYRKVFGKDNVLAMPYELLRDNPAQFTSLIEEAMGIKETFQFPPEKINAALDRKILQAYYRFSNFLYRAVQPLPYEWRKKIFMIYIYKLNHTKPHPLMKFISRFVKQDVSHKGMPEMIETFRGKCEVLREEPLYQPYLKEYLL
jgi:hypothetical protein